MTPKQFSLTLFSLAAFLFSICFLMAIYHSTQNVTASEIESIEKSLQKVGEDLKENDAPWGILTKFRNETDKLQADLRILAQSNNPDSELRRKTLDDLASVTLNLTTLQRQWSNERYANHSAVSESLLKLKTFRERLEPTTGLEKVAASAMTQLVAFVTGVGKLVVLLAWPIVALAIVWYLFRSKEAPKRITDLVSNFKSLEVAGFKLERADKVKANLEETFAQYREEVKNYYDEAIKRKSLNEKLPKMLGEGSQILEKINKARKASNPNAAPLQNYRCTLHVPDLLFADTFYQLLDYFPVQTNPVTRGRTWSYRFGFIGRTWRTEKSDVAAVSTNIEDLIDEWGMTRAEAEAAGKDRKSFLGVLIKDGETAVGLFYMDSKEENAFGPAGNAPLCKSILDILAEAKVTQDLASIRKELSGKAPKISIYSER